LLSHNFHPVFCEKLENPTASVKQFSFEFFLRAFGFLRYLFGFLLVFYLAHENV